MIFQRKDGTLIIINRKDYKDDESYFNFLKKLIQNIPLEKV